MIEEKSTGQTKSAKIKFWRQHIQAWQSSKLTQSAYCRQNHLKVHQLVYWKKKIDEPSQGVSFIQVPISHNLPIVASPSKVSVFTTNGFRIDVASGFDPVMLKQLIETVQQL